LRREDSAGSAGEERWPNGLLEYSFRPYERELTDGWVPDAKMDRVGCPESKDIRRKGTHNEDNREKENVSEARQKKGDDGWRGIACTMRRKRWVFAHGYGHVLD
jgi:hypothetical protein